MVRDAYPIVVPMTILSAVVIGASLLWPWLLIVGIVLGALTAFVAYFFRDPDRDVPRDPSVITSPADGRVVLIDKAPDEELSPGKEGTLVSIFLSVFDVHINRSPVAGKITSVNYRRGRFLVAMDHRSSVENEQNVVAIENESVRVVFKQIAGLIARRIVFWKTAGSDVALGERVGLIKFGSRVDVLLPANVTVTVKKGDRVKGGISVIGRVKR